MKSFAMALDLKEGPGGVEEYTRYHREVWTDVLTGLRGLGIAKMKIFLHGRRLFMYLETPDDFDLARDFPRYMECGRAKEWDALMRTFQEPVPRRLSGRVVGRHGGGFRPVCLALSPQGAADGRRLALPRQSSNGRQPPPLLGPRAV